uniref:Peptidase S1 domain-containing protein n=1 Tax=Anopheles dirus TaxID=7168 RepID=A0A182MYF6_9DIPT
MSVPKVRNLLLFSILLCAVRATFANDQRLVCGRRRVKVEYLLQHGTDAKAGHWPWHAAIFHRKANFEYACGGSILDQNTILTAAHCVSAAHGEMQRNRISVHVGRLHLNMENEYTQTLEVAELIVYPGFTVHGVVNDIALIKLTTNITMSVYVQPVCLWNMDDRQESIIGHNGTIVGFGLTEEDVVSEQLKQAFVCVGDPVECLATDRSVYGSHLTKEMFCGKGQEGVSACNGDSGGGMFFEVGGRWFIRGVVSFIPGRQNDSNLCDGSKSTVFTDVAKYLTWITEHIDQRAIVDYADDFAVDYEEKLKMFDFNSCGNYEKGSDIDWVGGLVYETPYGQPELRCMFTWINKRSYENLVTPVYNNYEEIRNVSYMNHSDCVRNYAKAGIPISLSDKNFCVELKNASGTNATCNPLPAGAPITTAAWHGGEPHFVLRGFNIFHQTCDSSKPLVNLNITQYMDWILYNMRNQLDDDVKDLSDLDSLYESLPAMEREDKEEEMFEEKHCGLATLDQRNLKQLDAASCQTRFMQHGYLIDQEHIPLCAIHSDNERQRPVPVVPGASLQVLLTFDGGNRYFLRGIQHASQYNSSSSNIENVLLPYLFTDIHSHIAWIVDTMKNQKTHRTTAYRNLYSSPSELGIGDDETEDDQ